ncbi:hypothetical protein [Rhizobium leguminosarum]|uniref:hypothetical protein n=1 Tax=Rhizobium leguminosarum TaxID=384 RepID=UPI003D07FF1C
MKNHKYVTPKLPPLPDPTFEQQLANEAYWRKVFSDDNVPLIEIKPGTHYKTLPSWFPSRKNPRGEIRAREPLVADLLIHLDTDPKIKRIHEFAVKIQYRYHKLDGTILVKEHIPDICVFDATGAVFVIDVMPFAVQQTMPGIQNRKASLQRHYAGLGAKYMLLDETTIHLRPLFQNLRLMWRHKRLSHEPKGMETLRQILRDHKLGCTVGDLMRTLPSNAIVARWSDEPTTALKHVSECNPVFTAIMQLAMNGEVEVDLDTRFSSDTMVTRKEKAHG